MSIRIDLEYEYRRADSDSSITAYSYNTNVSNYGTPEDLENTNVDLIWSFQSGFGLTVNNIPNLNKFIDIVYIPRFCKLKQGDDAPSWTPVKFGCYTSDMICFVKDFNIQNVIYYIPKYENSTIHTRPHISDDIKWVDKDKTELEIRYSNDSNMTGMIPYVRVIHSNAVLFTQLECFLSASYSFSYTSLKEPYGTSSNRVIDDVYMSLYPTSLKIDFIDSTAHFTTWYNNIVNDNDFYPLINALSPNNQGNGFSWMFKYSESAVKTMLACLGIYFFYDDVLYLGYMDSSGQTTGEYLTADRFSDSAQHASETVNNFTEHTTPAHKINDDIDDIGLNDFPFGSGGGLITYYALDRFDMDDFKVDIATIRSGVTVDPDKYIVGCWLLPIDLKVHTTSSRQAIKLGGTTTNASGYKITDAQKVFDFGSYSVAYNHNGSFLDYEPYTQVSLYVPYCGNIKIPTSLCMGRTVSVKMIVDIYSGGCRGCVFVGNTFYTSIGGSISTNVPVSVEQVASKTNALLNIGSTVLASAASGNIVASASAINSAMSTYNNIAPSVIGSVSDAILNFYLPQKCIISIVSPSVREEEYYRYHGKVNKTIKSIGQCSGFTVCEKVHTDGITRATKSERARISQYLQSGIII